MSEQNIWNDPEKVWNLKLYVAGESHKSKTAIDNLRKLCDTHLKGKCNVEIIDLKKNPEIALRDEILAVPTLIRELPEPIRKLIGDLSNTEKVLIGLEIIPEK